MESKRVLFALTSGTMRDFLPDFDESQYQGAQIHRTDPHALSPGEWEKLLHRVDAEVIVTGWHTPAFPHSYVAQSGSLKYLCHISGTVRSILPRSMIEKGVLVTNWGSTISHTIAEHAVLLVLAALRSLPRWKEGLDAWDSRKILKTKSLHGKKVGLHGFGNIAREITRRLKPFGVQISSYSPGVPSEIFTACEVTEQKSLEELFSSSDILIECEGLTPRNKGIVSREILALLPQDAIFVNIGRGAIADEEALAAAAANGKIRLATDVYTTEPLPQESALRKIPHALLSPHIAGPTHDALPLCGDFAMQNLRHYLADELDRMEGKVDLQVYDRIT